MTELSQLGLSTSHPNSEILLIHEMVLLKIASLLCLNYLEEVIQVSFTILSCPK